MTVLNTKVQRSDIKVKGQTADKIFNTAIIYGLFGFITLMDATAKIFL